MAIIFNGTKLVDDFAASAEHRRGIWTPWSQVLCPDCHEDDWGEDDYVRLDGTNALCRCTSCGCPVAARSDVACMANVVDYINRNVAREAHAATLWQSGGMCCNAYWTLPDGRFVTFWDGEKCLAGPAHYNLYTSEEAQEDGEFFIETGEATPYSLALMYGRALKTVAGGAK